MNIKEPVTLLTDYLLALAGVIFAVLLARDGIANRSILLWVIAFLAGAIAAAIGGTFHGFVLYMSEATRRRLWNATLISIGASAAFMISAGVASPLGFSRWLKWGLAISVAGLMVQLSGFRHGKNFNHNDAYHVIQLIALYCFYRGAK